MEPITFVFNEEEMELVVIMPHMKCKEIIRVRGFLRGQDPRKFTATSRDPKLREQLIKTLVAGITLK
jgi:hypothetical protein